MASPVVSLTCTFGFHSNNKKLQDLLDFRNLTGLLNLILLSYMFFKSSTYDQNAEVCDATGDATKFNCWAHKKILLCSIILLLSLNAIAQHVFTISFKNIVGDKILNTDSIYKNQFGEAFTVRNFKYYISNIILSDSINYTTQSFNDYFLINENDDTSKTIILTTTLVHVTRIDYLLGVDSLKNVSGVQTGALDPLLGMFWTWNSGYVMAKLEGTSPPAKTPAHAFSYHIGGYKQNENVAKKFSFAISSNNIAISADILKWFSGMHDIKISEVAFCHEPGKLAMMFADNYANMFSIETSK